MSGRLYFISLQPNQLNLIDLVVKRAVVRLKSITCSIDLSNQILNFKQSAKIFLALTILEFLTTQKPYIRFYASANEYLSAQPSLVLASSSPNYKRFEIMLQQFLIFSAPLLAVKRARFLTRLLYDSKRKPSGFRISFNDYTSIFGFCFLRRQPRLSLPATVMTFKFFGFSSELIKLLGSSNKTKSFELFLTSTVFNGALVSKPGVFGSEFFEIYGFKKINIE